MKKKIKKEIYNNIFPAFIVGLLLFFITSANDREVEFREKLGEYGERLARLEEKFDICIDCSNFRKSYGGYIWNNSKGKSIDNKGRTVLSIEINVLSKEYRWKCGGTKKVIFEGKTFGVQDIVNKYSESAELEDSKGIIALGTASYEGIEDTQEKLSIDRANVLTAYLKSSVSNKNLPIFSLNLGQYQKGNNNDRCSNHSIEQRRIILLKITEADADLLSNSEQLEQHIKNILLRKSLNPNEQFPIDIREYSMFHKNLPMLLTDEEPMI